MLRRRGVETRRAAVATAGWDCWTVGQLAQGHTRSNRATVKPSELGNPHQRDDNLRLLVPALHVRIEVRSPRDEHTLGTGVALHAKRLSDGLRLQVSERWQTQHQC